MNTKCNKENIQMMTFHSKQSIIFLSLLVLVLSPSTFRLALASPSESCPSNDKTNDASIVETKTKTPRITLANGVEMPQFAAGTCFRTGWVLRPDLAHRSVALALEAGIRHFDTALVYRSQKAISSVLGSAFARGALERDDVFLTTKVFHGPAHGVTMDGDTMTLDSMSPAEVTVKTKEHVERCLHELNVGYVDLLLLHWPADFDTKSTEEENRARRLAAWKVLESTLENGWTRSIGVSNFSEHHIRQLMEDGATVKPMVNQIETSVYVQYENIISYCQEEGIAIMAFSPLGAPFPGSTSNALLKDPVIVTIAEKLGKNVGQVAMRYLVQKGYALTALSTSGDRLKSNVDIFDFSLIEEDMDALDKLKGHKSMLGLNSPYELS